MRKIVALLLVLVCFGTASAWACSAFMLKGNGYRVVGFNENWITMPGMVVINPRGVQKTGLAWEQMVAEKRSKTTRIDWKSSYGSVTFNLLSIDMPCYGVNEKGLFVVELYLDKTYSVSVPAKPNLFWGQWIQYQLDQYATVAELLANLDQAPTVDWWPTFPGSHLFLADREGSCAAIEWIEGKMVVHAGDDMPQPVLCNDSYTTEMAALSRYVEFGGTETFVPAVPVMDGRFAKAAHALKRFDSTQNNPIAYSWELLNYLNPGNWQLVYDLQNGVLQFNSDKGPAVKQLTLSEIDFSAANAPRCLDILSDAQGEVLPLFVPLTRERNALCVERGFPVGYDNSDFFQSYSYQVLRRNLSRYVGRTYPKLQKLGYGA